MQSKWITVMPTNILDTHFFSPNCNTPGLQYLTENRKYSGKCAVVWFAGILQELKQCSYRGVISSCTCNSSSLPKAQYKAVPLPPLLLVILHTFHYYATMLPEEKACLLPHRCLSQPAPLCLQAMIGEQPGTVLHHSSVQIHILPVCMMGRVWHNHPKTIHPPSSMPAQVWLSADDVGVFKIGGWWCGTNAQDSQWKSLQWKQGLMTNSLCPLDN